MSENVNDITDADASMWDRGSKRTDFRAPANASREREEFRDFLADVEDLVKKLADASDVEVASLRDRVAGAIGDVRHAVDVYTDTLWKRARMAATVTDDYIKRVGRRSITPALSGDNIRWVLYVCSPPP
jgi:ElaB/YqjD/DUF883 family membrane-anchored ribosome-binding protein